jgi:phosphoglycolate phosphatase
LAGLGVDAGGTVMIGDRRHDSEAGRVHGTGTIGVLWGFGDADELEAAGPDRVVAAPAELGTALLGSA